MNRLSKQQQAFAEAIHGTQDASHLFGATARGASAYANNLMFNRADALTEAFPVVRQLVGEEFFDGMARLAARSQVSRSGDLNEYGSEFAQFVADFPPAQPIPYLADAARLDWLCHQAYFADDPFEFSYSSLAQLSPEQQASLRFALQPSVGIFSSPWPVASLWRAHQANDSADWSEFPSPDQGGETALVWRNAQRRVRVMRLLPAHAAFLKACALDLSFTEALERALDIDMEFDLGVSLERWISDQVITYHSNGAQA